jgi:hypothetical protein
MSVSAVRLGRALVAALMVAACARRPEGASPDIRVLGDSIVEVHGVSPAVLADVASRSNVLRVVVDALTDSATQDPQPVLGSHEVLNGRLRFMPHFPFAPGIRYRVELDPHGMAEWRAMHRFTIAGVNAGTTTRVVAVHPTDSILPSNVLRFTIEFSAPMAGGRVVEHIRVLDERGQTVPGVFLEMNDDLWDAERRSVTLLVDPGRIKRGIRSNLELGAPFVAGRRYRLEIDSTLRDASGAPLAQYRRDLRIGNFDAVRPDPASWRVSSPRAGTRDTLRVEFAEPLDHALALRLVSVVDLTGAPVTGRAVLESHDRVWSFLPASPWLDSDLLLRIAADLEDLAGNSVRRVFDSDRLTGGPAVVPGHSGVDRTLRIRVAGIR